MKLYLFIIIISLVAGTLLLFFFIGDDFGLGAWGEEPNEAVITSETSATQDLVLAQPITAEAAAENLEETELVLDTECIGPRLSEDGQTIWFYDGIEKRLRQVNLLGEDVVVGRVLANDVSELVWSPDGSQFVYQSSAGKYYLYNLDAQEEVLLGTNIESPVWVSENEIWYQFVDPEGEDSSIRVATPQSGLVDSQEVMASGSGLVLKKIPSTNNVAYYLPPSVGVPSAVYSVNRSGDKKLVVSKSTALEASWSLRGDLLVFSRLNDGLLELLAASQDGSNPAKLARSTFVDKIGFTNGSEGLYAAVPKRIANFTKYQQAGVGKEDDLYYLSRDGATAELVTDFSGFSERIDARDLFLSQNGKLLYFINSYNDSLYVVNLDKIDF